LGGVLSAEVAPIVVFELPGEVDLEIPGWDAFKRLGKGRRQPSACFFRRAVADDR
jgi:hypothetical protein